MHPPTIDCPFVSFGRRCSCAADAFLNRGSINEGHRGQQRKLAETDGGIKGAPNDIQSSY